MSRATTRNRAVALLAAASTVALAATACSSGSEGGEQSEGPVDLRMTVWSANDGHHEVFNQIADAYVEEHPEQVSSISFDALPGGNYVNALTTQIAGGDAPDLAWIFESYASQFVETGVFADLTPTLTQADGYDYDDLLPAAMEPWSVDGNVYAYPFSNTPLGIYVNNDALASAGQPDPRELIASGEWTWDKLVEIAAATARSEDVAGFLPTVVPYSSWNDSMGPIWLSWGASAWSEDGTRCAMTTPEMTDFMTWFHTQIFDVGSIPGPGEEYDFGTGQAAFKMAALSASTGLGDDFTWDFLPLPSGPAGTVPVVGQAGLGVVARGDHPEVAADFLAYFTNQENSTLLAQYFPPPRESLLDVRVLQDAAPALTTEQLQGTIIDQAANAVTKEGNPRMGELVDPVRIAFDDLWTPDADVSTVLASVCEAMDAQLADG